MRLHRCALALGLLFAASLGAGQADQTAKAQKERDAQQNKDAKGKDTNAEKDALANLMGGAKIDQAAAERGRKVFVPTCGFCHGNDAHGKSGPDLVRSTLVLHDKAGDTIGPVIRNGRPDRGMPAFSNLSGEQIADISTFLHSRAADVSNRFAYKIGDLITGDPQKGLAFFNGEGGCTKCHSATSAQAAGRGTNEKRDSAGSAAVDESVVRNSPKIDLAHVASKYEPVELQRRMLYPAPNLIDVFLGKAVKPPAPTKVTVHLPSGEQVTGTLDHMDEFTVALRDSSGWYRSFERDDVKVDIDDPRAGHEALLPKMTDDDMHNLLAYLETLK